MQAILTSGHTIECANFKAIDSGVVLTADEKRKQVIGFVPNERLAYVVPDDRAPDLVGVIESEGAIDSGSESEASELDDRLDAIEARFDELTGEIGETSTVGSGVSITVQEETESVDETGAHVDVVYDESATAASEGTGESETATEAPGETAPEGTEAEEGVDDAADTDAIEGVESEGDAEAESDEDQPEAESDERGAETAGGASVEAEAGQPDPDEGATAVRDSDEGVETVEDEGREAEADAEPEDAESESEESELTTLRGLGPTYAGRLEAAGIATIDDVRATSVEELAEAADVAESRADDWKRQVTE